MDIPHIATLYKVFHFNCLRIQLNVFNFIIQNNTCLLIKIPLFLGLYLIQLAQTMEALFIGLGGFIGAVARYYLGNMAHKWLDIYNFPVGILIVNIIGCFVIGILSGIVDNKILINENFKSLLIIGLLGSFTTIATFSNDTLKFLTEGNIFYAMLNVFLSVIVGLIFVWLGYFIAKFI